MELSRSERSVQKFRIEHNLLATQAGSLTDQQLSELNIALINARAELSEKRAQISTSSTNYLTPEVIFSRYLTYCNPLWSARFERSTLLWRGGKPTFV